MRFRARGQLGGGTAEAASPKSATKKQHRPFAASVADAVWTNLYKLDAAINLAPADFEPPKILDGEVPLV